MIGDEGVLRIIQCSSEAETITAYAVTVDMPCNCPDCGIPHKKALAVFLDKVEARKFVEEVEVDTVGKFSNDK